MTHSHPDHVGALPKLLQAYPNISVAYHESEQPLLSGKGKYADLPGDNIQYNLVKRFIPSMLHCSPQQQGLVAERPIWGCVRCLHICTLVAKRYSGVPMVLQACCARSFTRATCLLPQAHWISHDRKRHGVREREKCSTSFVQPQV